MHAYTEADHDELHRWKLRVPNRARRNVNQRRLRLPELSNLRGALQPDSRQRAASQELHRPRLESSASASAKVKIVRSLGRQTASVPTGDNMMIFRTIREREAQEIIKQALCANAVEMQIEEHDGSRYVKFVAQTQPGQVAYSAYRASRGGKAHDGTPLPQRIEGDMLIAWDAFADAVMAGQGVDQAYQRYLAERSGLAVGGSSAPDWDELRNTKPDIAAAWADAANALTPAP